MIDLPQFPLPHSALVAAQPSDYQVSTRCAANERGWNRAGRAMLGGRGEPAATAESMKERA